MRIAKYWKDFEVLDATSGEKLERWGDITLIRPDPQVIWHTPRKDKGWENAHAAYRRSESGGGGWINHKAIPEEWSVAYRDLRFIIRPTGFKHTGLFPEQSVNWDMLGALVKAAGDELSVLNLFAYTGGATLACASQGARVCHVDAARGMVAWARQNAAASSLADMPVRWIVDDCQKFVSRELRRGSRYDGVVMDPPSYGRGPGGELWKLEDDLYGLVELCTGLLDARSRFFLLNSYTTGLSPSVMGYLLEVLIRAKLGGKVIFYELGLPVAASGGILPCGSSALWVCEELMDAAGQL